MHYKQYVNKVQSFFKKYPRVTSLLFLSLLLCAAGTFMIKDPFHLRYRNEAANLTQKEIEVNAKKVADICIQVGMDTRQECYEAQLALMTKTYGLANAETILFSVQDKDSFAKGCHLIAHYMAHEAYLREEGNFYSMLDSVDVGSCGGGFLHGILQGYTGEHPEIKVDGTFATNICERSKDQYRVASCVHFMGHIFIVRTEGDKEKALALCSDVPKKWQYNCYDGVFMEDHQKVMLSDHGIMPLPTLDKKYFNEMETACKKYEDAAGQACWTEMAEMYAHGYGYDAPTIFKNCSEAQNELFAKACYTKGVIAMSIYPGFDTKEKLTSLCSFYPSNSSNYTDCTQTLISSLIYNSPKFTPRGVIVCSNMATQSLQNECFQYFNEKLKTIVPQRKSRVTFCTMFPASYRTACMQ